MTLPQIQAERLDYLLRFLLNESGQVADIPADEAEQRRWLRSLVNVRPPKPVPDEVLAVQDAYLQSELQQKIVTSLTDLTPVEPQLYLWQGDITTLAVDGIVNAANNALLGCFVPCHACIDNAIHTAAGMQLRAACDAMMQQQGHPEPTGNAKITPAFNLPSQFVLHTVGPIIDDEVSDTDRQLLASCYRSCLKLADENGLQSLAFCCISTGEFRFPNALAADIAVQTVHDYLRETHTQLKVIFNVFSDKDHAIYRQLFD